MPRGEGVDEVQKHRLVIFPRRSSRGDVQDGVSQGFPFFIVVVPDSDLRYMEDRRYDGVVSSKGLDLEPLHGFSKPQQPRML